MAQGGFPIENEVKLRAPGAGEARALLENAGYRIARPRAFESNDVYDTPEEAFRRRDELVRVRRVAGAALLTFKSEGPSGRHKSRREVETAVRDPGALHLIFERLGLRVAFRYEKYRTEYRAAESGGVAMLDETPIGTFLELEGPPEWVDAAARGLGFSEAEYIVASYGDLYLERCRAEGRSPGHMTFEGQA